MAPLLNTDDFRLLAKRRLPRGLFEYIDRGTEDETALRRIREDLDAVQLVPRILSGVSAPDLSATVLGRQRPTPLVIAPTALAGMVADRGETRLARAASRFGIPFTVSTQSVEPIEDIARGAPEAELWFQLYVWQDRALTRDLLRRVEACDCRVLVLTVDTQMPPKREYNLRNGFGVPFRPGLRNVADMLMRPGWLARVILPGVLRRGMPSYGHYPPEFRAGVMTATTAEGLRLEPRLSWQDFRALRGSWKGQIVLKGVLSPEDARRAAAEGADAIVVSAHGGRNFDALASPARVLPGLKPHADLPELIADSGVRRGSDILRYIGLGAKAVMLGRAALWGLAAGGEAGAERLFEMILQEVRTSMGFLGASDLSRIETI